MIAISDITVIRCYYHYFKRDVFTFFQIGRISAMNDRDHNVWSGMFVWGKSWSCKDLGHVENRLLWDFTDDCYIRYNSDTVLLSLFWKSVFTCFPIGRISALYDRDQNVSSGMFFWGEMMKLQGFRSCWKLSFERFYRWLLYPI